MPVARMLNKGRTKTVDAYEYIGRTAPHRRQTGGMLVFNALAELGKCILYFT